ncbi:SDR family oxidoreductase [Shewanella sp. 202IG2-18]|uniref:SDR family NAD(P)-dependent oxidoreductase n=1 Tax=Parashewanella hymeniacidonis TaxID=2807618 RepID=UPI0019617803|nr:SDR family oxidoreductase [Parashewanella hymeniacidonis]MBM7070837.1 SDR family oxidoreductase [Parashewanella hymeniacidonis]
MTEHLLDRSTYPTVVITGASKGVGEACAILFAQSFPDGVNIVVVARNVAGLHEIKNKLQAYPQCNVLMVTGDVSINSCCRHMIQQAVSYFGKIDVLVNNAGLHHRGDFEKREPDELASMVDVNLKAPIYLTALALPYMPSNKKSAIIMVGSLAGRAPLQGAAVYSATKSGLRAFTYALADEFIARKIKVAVVSPGPIHTSFIMDEIDHVEDIVYSQPMSTAEQVAQAILELTQNNKTEIAMPWLSGVLTTVSYLFPKVRRGTRPMLYKIGAKNKNKYRQ